MDWMIVIALGIIAVILLGGLALTESWELIIILAICAVVVTKVM